MGERQGVEGQDEKGEQHQPGVHAYKGRTTEVAEKSSESNYTLPAMTILQTTAQSECQPRKFKSFQD